MCSCIILYTLTYICVLYVSATLARIQCLRYMLFYTFVPANGLGVSDLAKVDRECLKYNFDVSLAIIERSIFYDWRGAIQLKYESILMSTGYRRNRLSLNSVQGFFFSCMLLVGHRKLSLARKTFAQHWIECKNLRTKVLEFEWWMSFLMCEVFFLN